MVRLAAMRMVAVVLALTGTQAAADWEHHYYPAETAGELSVCTAGIHYADGPFLLRVYGRTVDFYLEDEELALPPDRFLGTVLLDFHDAEFAVAAESGWDGHDGPVNHLYLTPEDGDVAPLLGRLRRDAEMDIVFPDGLYYTIGLAGSSEALIEAFECWNREATGPVAAPRGRNPFAAPAARNPFE